MRMKAALILSVLALCGCGNSEEEGGSTTSSMEAPATDVKLMDAKKLEIGDVEATVNIELTPEDPTQPGIALEELRSATQKLNFSTITVSAPAPAELWISVKIATLKDFEGRPTALRGVLYREITKDQREELLTFNTVLDAFASSHRRTGDGDYPPLEFRANILQGLTQLPESMLIFGEALISMSPQGTETAEIDPATYTAPAGDTGSLISNPVRVNYTGTAAPVVEAEPTAEVAPEAEAEPTAEVAPEAEVAPTAEVAPNAEVAPAAEVQQ